VSAPSDPVETRLLSSPGDPLFWPALELYVETFPRDEREPLERVARVASGDPDLCRDPEHRVLLAVAESGGSLAGLAYFTVHAVARTGFLIYLAADPRHRKAGVGTRLTEFVRETCRREAADMGSSVVAVFLECERPELAASPEEEAYRHARVEFFLRRGARVVTKSYHQPALAPDREHVPLWLLAFEEEPCDWPHLVPAFHRLVLGYPVGCAEESEALAGFVEPNHPR
jgi:GNAT superfamily N-acetyltransferase